MKSQRHDVAYLADWLDWSSGEHRYCHRWIPCRQAREVQHVCIAIHGLGDHGGRFQELGEYLASHGVPVQAVDLVGHGRSPGKRGRIKSYEGLLDEIAWSIQEANQVWRNAHITLLGHSMGGNLALTYAAKRMEKEQDDAPKDILSINQRETPKNIIAIAPMLRPSGKPLREDFFRVGCQLAKWLPNWPMRMNSSPELLTRDKRKQTRYRQDQFVHRTMSIRLGIELLLTGRDLTNAKLEPNAPTLLIHGTDDQLADIAGSRALHRQCDQVHLHELTEEQHDPLNGEQQAKVYSMILAWCFGESRDVAHETRTLVAA